MLGSTGSIGTQALEVVDGSSELEVVGLAAAQSWEPLIEQARAHGVDRIALAEERAASRASEAWTEGDVLAGAPRRRKVDARSRAMPRYAQGNPMTA